MQPASINIEVADGCTRISCSCSNRRRHVRQFVITLSEEQRLCTAPGLNLEVRVSCSKLFETCHSCLRSVCYQQIQLYFVFLGNININVNVNVLLTLTLTLTLINLVLRITFRQMIFTGCVPRTVLTLTCV